MSAKRKAVLWWTAAGVLLGAWVVISKRSGNEMLSAAMALGAILCGIEGLWVFTGSDKAK